jgi:CheY-like chemotaxis protein
MSVSADPAFGPSLKFDIHDTGIGIPQAAVSGLFDRFTQADGSHSRRYGGTGLGLSISRELVHLMGGSIGVSSSPGKGSHFWFSIPVAIDATQTSAEPVKVAASAPAMDGALPLNLSVLVVDDNEINRTYLSLLLHKSGARCETAIDGHEAVDLVKTRDYDLVLMDMQMPVMDGIDATRAILALAPGRPVPPIIGVTANARPEDAAACLAAGMVDVLLKPISVGDLLTKVQAAVRRDTR